MSTTPQTIENRPAVTPSAEHLKEIILAGLPKTNEDIPEVPVYLKDKQINYQDIRLYDTYAEMKLLDGRTKVVTIAAIHEALEKSINTSNNVKLEDLLLPPGCYIFSRGVSDMYISCYYPEKIKKVTFGSSPVSSFEIPFPNTIISHFLKKDVGDRWMLNETYYFATSKNPGALSTTHIKKPDHKEQIWALPMPNMYGTGTMCFGNNTMPRQFDKNLRGLDWFYAVLFNSPFNGDLGVPSTRSYARSPAGWLKKLSEFKAFPYDLLSS
jgi:hypothetical protein